MSRYVDGFVIPIPAKNIERYREMAEKAGAIWKEHGALDYYECVGDDLDIDKVVSFKTLANTSEDETVVFAFIVYESREHRDKVNEAVMADPRLKESMNDCADIFDYKKMAFGGFKTIVQY